MREQLREKILNEIAEETKENKLVKLHMERLKERILKADKEYKNRIPEVSEKFAKSTKLTKDQLYAIGSYIGEGEVTEHLPEMTLTEYNDIIDEWNDAISVLASEIEDKYNVSIEHEEYVIRISALPSIFYIEYTTTVFDKEGDFEIDYEWGVREALEKAIDKTERLVMRRCRRNRRG